MKIFDCPCKETTDFPFSVPIEKVLYVDIETTGLAAKTSALYLIGCLYFSENQWHCKQWFADDYQSEARILQDFITFASSYALFVDFNGSHFDFPFLIEKCKQHEMEIPACFSAQQLDLYKYFRPWKHLFSLENCKLKTLEGFTGITRKDRYSGKQLTKLYQNFHTEKRANHTESFQALEEILLLHNREDLTGMLALSNFYIFIAFLQKETILSTVEVAFEDGLFLLNGTLAATVGNATYTWEVQDAYLQIKGVHISLVVKPVYDTLYHFYKDYKHYVYLQLEDYAMHKSLANFIDKSFQQPATKETCYTKQTGFFLPIYTGSTLPIFKTKQQTSQDYIALDENLCQNKQLMAQYLYDFIVYHPDVCIKNDYT